MSERSVLPTARAAVFAAVCVALSVVAHELMSKTSVPLWSVGVAAAAVFVLARLWAGEERGFATIALLMGIGQLALHLWFVAAEQAVAPTTGGCESMTAMPGMGTMSGMCRESSGTSMMFLAHVAVALIAAWWLYQGELAVYGMIRLLWSLVTRWVFRLASLAAGLLPAVRPATRPVRVRTEPARCAPPVSIRYVVVRHGPPNAVLAV